MQTPALFKPMNLGAGFDGFGEGEDDFFTQYVTGSNTFKTDYGLDLSLPDSTNVASDLPLNLPENVAVVNQAGDVVDKNGRLIVSADAITRAAMTPGADVNQAVVREIQTNSPDYAKQFKTAGDLTRAAADIFNVAKAVIQGKPIPPSPYVYNPNNPGVYNPNVYRPSTATNQLSMSSTNMLLIGGVALAAFLVLRKK